MAGPVYCEGSSGFRCFPKATVASASAILKSKGATCKNNTAGDRVKCAQGVRVGGYTVRCEPPTRFAVNDESGNPYTSWSAGFTISSY